MVSTLTQFLLAVVTTFAHAQSEPTGEIREIDSGACWVQGSSDTAWKIASFNDNSAFYVFPDDAILSVPHKLETKLTDKLRTLFPSFEKSDYRIHLHCSGAGHQVLISVMNAKTPLCVWAKKSSDSNLSLDIHTVLPNPHPASESACYGVAPASFLFVVADKNDPAALERYLLQRYGSSIESTRVSNVLGYVHVQLKQAHAFKEREFRDLFLQDEKIAAVIRTIEFDGAVITSGEELFLLQGSYSGY